MKSTPRALRSSTTRRASASFATGAELGKRGGCWFERGPLKVHLGVEADFHPARKAHPAFLVDDLTSLKGALEARDYRVNSDVALEGYDRIFVDDPFGNRIELMQRR